MYKVNDAIDYCEINIILPRFLTDEIIKPMITREIYHPAVIKSIDNGCITIAYYNFEEQKIYRKALHECNIQINKIKYGRYKNMTRILTKRIHNILKECNHD